MLAKRGKKLLAVLLAMMMVVGLIGTAASATGGEPAHLESCGYVCGHVCSAESGCITMKTCVHDGDCAYQEAVYGVCDCGAEGGAHTAECASNTIVSEAVACSYPDGIAVTSCIHDHEAEACEWVCADGCPVAAEENGEENPNLPVIPEESCTVDYQTQSEDVTVTVDGDSDPDYILVDVVIGENASGDQVITFSDEIIACLRSYNITILPGASLPFKVTVTNLSGHDYQYKNNSFVLASADAHAYEQSNFLGYDGQLIPWQFIGAVSVTNSKIYKGLFGVSSSGKVTAEMMFNIYDYLEAKGYTGEDALTRYLLDAYNVDSVSELKGDTFASAGSNGIFQMSKEMLAAYEAAHPELRNCIYATENSDGSMAVQIRWPEAELAALSYNQFYQDLWAVSFGKENTMNPNPSGNLDFCRAHGIGDYLFDDALYAETNTYFIDLMQPEALDTGAEFFTYMAWDGPNIGNGYQRYAMSYYFAMTLEQVDSDVTVNKVDESGNALDGAQFKLYQLADTAKLYYTVDEAGTADWTENADDAKVFDAGSFTVNLPFGTYYLSEITTPSGYEAPETDVEIVVDETAELINVVNTAEPYIPPVPGYTYYNVTVNYYDLATGEKIAESYVSGSILSGNSYDVTSRRLESITVGETEYTYDSTSGDALSGTMDGNKVINLYYVAGEDVEDPDVPLDPGPTLPPEPTDPEEPDVDIDDPDVPQSETPGLDGVPQTGDNDSLLLWLLLTFASGAGLVSMLLGGRRRAQSK